MSLFRKREPPASGPGAELPRAAWKTGTSAAFRDAWTALWTPEEVATPTGRNPVAATRVPACLRVWHKTCYDSVLCLAGVAQPGRAADL